MERAIGILRPTMLVAVQDIQTFHRTASDGTTYIRPYFLQSPAAIREHTAKSHLYVTATFQHVLAIGRPAGHHAHETFKTRP